MKATEPVRLLQRIHLIDLTAFGWCHRRGTTSAVFTLARGISRTADGWLYAMLPLLYLVSGADAELRLVTLCCCAFLGERAFYFAMKNTCRRRRPPEVLPGFESLVIASDRFSFPSGHTSAAFLFAGICSLEFGGWAALLLYPWAGCVGVSRVLLGVHFPSDIVAGAVLGSCLLLLSRMALAV